MSDDQDESVLVLLVQSGDVAAFEKLLARLYRPLRSYVLKMVGEVMADDVLQEISLRIYQQIRLLREPKAFRPWVYRIATRIAFVHLKRDKRWRKWENDREPVETASQPEFQSELLSMVDLVSPSSRAVLLLHYQQNLSLEETAAILDIPLGTAKSRLSYGLAALRNLIKENKNEH